MGARRSDKSKCATGCAPVVARRSGANLPSRLALTDADRAPDPLVLLSALPSGSGLVWRAYSEATTRAKLNALRAAARTAHVALWVTHEDHRRSRMAEVNIHLPERALKTPLTDGMFKGPRSNSSYGLVTAAAHSKRAIVAAARAGVDAVLISPVFSTRSHPGGSALGVTRFAALARFARSLGLGVYALGGITDATKIRRLKQSGAIGIAGIDIFIKRDQA